MRRNEVIDPGGQTGQKIELLADGQQIVAFGLHPDTKKPYSWFGGTPETISHEELLRYEREGLLPVNGR